MRTDDKYLLAPALCLALLAAATAVPALAQSGDPFTIGETGEGFQRLSDAVEAIGDGQGTIIVAPGRYRQCAVQEAGRIAYVAEEQGTAIFDGVACEGKAALVLRGQAARVEGLTFRNIRVEDGNGAGIRIEQGDLDVAYTHFENGECGILSATDESGAITIDHSTFSGLGKHPDGNGAHSLYIGHYGSLKVTNSRFERGTGGHYLKSRSPHVEILGNSFDDSKGQTTNYLIDLPSGATGRVAGNVFLNGTGKENYSTLIAVAAEEQEHPTAGLVIEENEASLAPGFEWSTTFVTSWTDEPLEIRNNRLAKGIALFKQR